jgi:TRAP-type C4-dicarboxylate transport system substrate-binding protein
MLRKMSIICLVSLFIFMGMAITDRTESQAKTYNWKMISPFPPGDTANMGCDAFARNLEAHSNGQIRITLYQGSLGSPRDAWDMVTSNTVQLAWTGDLYNPGRIPITQMVALPFEVPNVRVAQRVMDKLLNAGLLKEMTDNFELLYFLPSYPICLYSKEKKITKVEDFKGMKVRCGTGLQGKALIALGASTVSLPGGEEYMSLQTGVIDATTTGINIGIHRKLYEVAKYAMKKPPLYFGILFMMMNKETWNSIPQDLQKLIEDEANSISSSQLDEIVNQEAAMWDQFSEVGESYSLSLKEQERMREVIGDLPEKHAAELSSKGYPGKEALALIRKVIGQK